MGEKNERRYTKRYNVGTGEYEYRHVRYYGFGTRIESINPDNRFDAGVYNDGHGYGTANAGTDSRTGTRTGTAYNGDIF